MLNSRKPRYTRWLTLLLLALMALPVMAADKDKEKAAKQQERRMRQMMQQVQAEKDQLQSQFEQEKTKLKEETEAEQAKNNALQGSVASANRKNAALSSELDTLRQDKARLENSILELQAKLEASQQQFAASQELVRKGDAERANMQATLVNKQQQMNASRDKNARLYDFGLQLIKVYEQPSLYQKVMRDEPFTQLKRVELENILQDYKDKIDEARVKPGELKP